MGRGRPKKLVATHTLMEASTSKTPVQKSGNDLISDHNKTPMEQWPTLMNMKDRGQTPMIRTEQASIIHTEAMIAHAVTNSSGKGTIEQNTRSITKEIEMQGDVGELTSKSGEEVGKGQKQWANLFVGSTYAAKSMDLSYIPPIIKNGEITVELCKEEIDEETQK